MYIHLFRQSRKLFIFIGFLIALLTARTGLAQSSLWPSLRSDFKLSRENDKIKSKIKHYRQRPNDITHLTSQAAPYLYYVYQEAKKRHMPAEIALLPMIESDYNPFARSSAGAKGLWQLMRVTAKDFGVVIHHKYDERMHILLSTQAALDYLSYLHNYFHDWLLAIAAYNSGQGTVLSAIHKNLRQHKPISFWALDLPKQTRAYVPKLLAIANVIQHSDRLNIKLGAIPNKPFFSKVTLNMSIDAKTIAKLAQTPVSVIKKLNPVLPENIAKTHQPYFLLIPQNQSAIFKRNLRNWLSRAAKHPTKITVKPHDTLLGIALRYHRSLSEILKINNLKSDTIRAGQALLIPGKKERSSHRK